MNAAGQKLNVVVKRMDVIWSGKVFGETILFKFVHVLHERARSVIYPKFYFIYFKAESRNSLLSRSVNCI